MNLFEMMKATIKRLEKEIVDLKDTVTNHKDTIRWLEGERDIEASVARQRGEQLADLKQLWEHQKASIEYYQRERRWNFTTQETLCKVIEQQRSEFDTVCMDLAHEAGNAMNKLWDHLSIWAQDTAHWSKRQHDQKLTIRAAAANLTYMRMHGFDIHRLDGIIESLDKLADSL